MRVSSNIKQGLDTATIPSGPTRAGDRPSAPYLGDGGSGGTVTVGPRLGAPLAQRPGDPEAGAEGPRVEPRKQKRELRSKESRRLGYKASQNKIPKLGSGTYDPNTSIYAGSPTGEKLAKQQRRGTGSKRFTELVSGASSDVTYRETTEPRLLSSGIVSKIADGNTDDVAIARHLAKHSKSGYLKPGSIETKAVELPEGTTDVAKMARMAFYGQQARQRDIDAGVNAAITTNKASARKLGLAIDPELTDAAAERLGAKQPGHEGLYGSSRDVKKAIAVRDRYVRKYGHKLSDEGIRNLPGVSREEAAGLTPHAEVERKTKTLDYYMGAGKDGTVDYNKGLESTRIQELAAHLGHKPRHIAAWAKSRNIDIETLHKDVSEQVHDKGAKKKAWEIGRAHV